MSDKQKEIIISAEEAIQRFGSYYLVEIGKHEEDFHNIGISQCLGKPPSNFERYTNTLEEAIALHDEILKEHCKNAIGRYNKSSKTIKGEVLYFLYKQGWLKKERQQEIDEYLKVVEDARKLLSTGKKPVLKLLYKQYSILENYPKLEEKIYVVNQNITNDYFKVKNCIVVRNEITTSQIRGNPEIEKISVSIEIEEIDNIVRNNYYIRNVILEMFNGSYYPLGNEIAFIRSKDAQEYANKKLNDLIEKATVSIEMNTKTV